MLDDAIIAGHSTRSHADLGHDEARRPEPGDLHTPRRLTIKWYLSSSQQQFSRLVDIFAPRSARTQMLAGYKGHAQISTVRVCAHPCLLTDMIGRGYKDRVRLPSLLDCQEV